MRQLYLLQASVAVGFLYLIFLKDCTNSKGRDFPIALGCQKILVGVHWSDNAEHSDSPQHLSYG